MLVPAPTQVLTLALGIGVVLNASMAVVALRGDSSPDTEPIEAEPIEAEPVGAARAGTVAPRTAAGRIRMIEQVFRLPVEEFPRSTPPPPTHSEKGVASWYDAPRATCAHKSIKKGTVVTVTRPATGATVTCKVADRGPFIEGRIIDLSRDTFVALAGADVGVFDVRIQW